MKKYTSVFVCLCLLIVSVAFLPSMSYTMPITVGTGDGEGEKIENLADVERLIDRFSDSDFSALNNALDKGVFVLTTSSDIPSELSNKEQNYNSFSAFETAYMAVSYSNQTASYRQTIDRKLSIYVAENVTYYHSIGEVSSYTSGSALSGTSPEREYVIFDIEAFVDSTNDTSILKINQFDDVSKNRVVFSSEALNRWISSDELDFLSDIDQMNKDAFNELAGVINTAIRKDLFDYVREEYILKDNDFFEAFGLDYNEEDLGQFGECTVNLSNAEEPVLSMEIGGTSIYMDVEYTFKDINNTIIKLPQKIDVLEIDEDNVERYIKVVEMED